MSADGAPALVVVGLGAVAVVPLVWVGRAEVELGRLREPPPQAHSARTASAHADTHPTSARVLTSVLVVSTWIAADGRSYPRYALRSAVRPASGTRVLDGAGHRPCLLRRRNRRRSRRFRRRELADTGNLGSPRCPT